MHNRLERVRQRQEYRWASDGNATPAGGTVELFNDYAVIDHENRSFLFGNLVRLVCASQHGQLEYKQPVSYQDPKRGAIASSFNMYIGVEDQRGAFKSTSDLHEVCFTNFITHVTMVTEVDGTLKISEEELAEVEGTTSPLIQELSDQNAQRMQRRLNNQYASDFGITRTVVSPDESHTDGLWRSQRMRTVVNYHKAYFSVKFIKLKKVVNKVQSKLS